MITFQHQGIAATQCLHEMRRGLPRIGQHTELQTTIRCKILHRFARIVRYGKRRQLQIADRQTIAVAAKMQGHAAAIGSQRLISSEGEPYRNAVPARELEYAAAE